MKTNRIGALRASVIAFAWAGFVPALAANTLSKAEQASGFKLLFDGVSTSQWTANWPIEDSAMKSPGGGPALNSKEKYANFEWRVDIKVNAGGNSGLFIRVDKDDYCDGFEVGILDSKDGEDANDRSQRPNQDRLPAGIFNINTGADFAADSDAPIKRTGGIYDIYPTTENGITIPNGGKYIDLMRPAGVWNSIVVWADGKHIETWLNGMKVTDFMIGSPDWFARFHRSKFGKDNNQCGDDYSAQATGVLAAQDHGHGLTVWIRNNKIRTFTPGSKLTTPVAEPVGATFGTATKVKLDAGITGAAIRYTLDGTDPTETSTLYSDSAGLMVTQTAKLKFRSYRANFGASDVASEAYMISGSGIAPSSKAVPRVSFIRTGAVLRIENRNGMPFAAELVTLDGARLWNGNVGDAPQEVSLAGLRSGVYLVRMQSAGWTQTRLLAIP